jgi:pimeloyl-ACP methyl ester carboxylesterase
MTHPQPYRFTALIVLGAVAVAVAGARPTNAAEPPPFAVKVSGKGPAMILIPGLTCAGEVWDGAVEHFSKRYECHVLTLPGFAGQPPMKADAPYTETVRESIADYIREKKLDKPIIVGHSVGGFLAFALASAEPDLVGPVVSVDGLPCLMGMFNPDLPKENYKEAGEQIANRMAGQPREQYLAQQKGMIAQWTTDPKRLEMLEKWGAASDQAAVAKAAGEIFGADLRDSLSSIKTPVLLVGAFHPGITQFFGVDRDGYTKRFESQVAKAPKARVVVADNAKHFIMYDAPDWLWKQMDEFLAATPAK